MKLSYRFEYLALRSIAALVRALPRTAALALGRNLGRFGRLVQPRRVAIARDNLQHAFPEMSIAERDAVIRKMFCHLGASFVEMLRLDLYDGQADLDKYFTIEGLEHLEEVIRLGRGGIMLSGHVGFWEAGSYFLPLLGTKAGFVAKPMRNPLVGAYFEKMRTANGCYMISSRKGARRIVKTLQQNHLVGLLMDQHVRPKDAVLVPFFGRPAYTTPIITQIAMKLQTPILPSFAYRTDDNRYMICFEPMFTLEAGDMSEEQIVRNTALLTEKIEQGIRRDITQWFWLHRRWRDKKPERPSRDETRGDVPFDHSNPSSPR